MLGSRDGRRAAGPAGADVGQQTGGRPGLVDRGDLDDRVGGGLVRTPAGLAAGRLTVEGVWEGGGAARGRWG
jgi:hypothetical protein